MTNTKPLNIVLIGDPGTGKTNLLSRLAKNHFNPKYEPSTGINDITYDIHVGDQTTEIDLWDLAGRKKYRRLTDSLLPDADGILLVYDVSDPATFENLSAWLSFIRESVPPKTVIKLVGNKNDLQNMVPRNEAEQFAGDNALSYIETSALNNSNVHLAFESIAREINLATSEPPFSSTDSFVQKGPKASSDDNDQQEKPFQIVLIDIYQAACKHNIVCVEKPLDEANLEFIAISYRWGEVYEQVIDTKLGYIATVTSFALNDFHTLCLRIKNEPDLQSIKYVWVDAICVDQNNHARRKATIYQMSNIYHRATYILAVPDLHLQYLKNNQIIPFELQDIVDGLQYFIYYLLQEDTDQLVRITEQWFDEMNIPKDTMARKELTSNLTDPLSPKRFTEYLDAYNVQVSDSLCDDDCQHNCYNSYFYFWPLDCHNAPRAMLDHIQYAINNCHDHPENTNMVYENSGCALCSLQMDMCQHQRKSFNKNEIIPDSDQKWLACVIRELLYDKYRSLVTEKSQEIARFMGYLKYLIKDWSSRVWVISEYNIAKAKRSRKMKFWFLSLNMHRLILGKLSFFKFEFDKLGLIPKSDNSLNFVISEANKKYREFQETLRSQLNERSFLEMMLDSKASRNEDRFYAIFPSSEYKTVLTSREVVSSWQIDNIVSVKLKLFELMTTKDKLHLLYWTGMYASKSSCGFPAFANANLERYRSPPIEARNKKNKPCNFDLNNNATLRLVPPMDNENGFLFHKLSLSPKMYYAAHVDGDPDAKEIFVDNKQGFWKALEINCVDDDLLFVRIPMYMYIDWDDVSNSIVLLGSFKKNKWLLCKTSTAYYFATGDLPYKDYDNSDGNLTFDIY